MSVTTRARRLAWLLALTPALARGHVVLSDASVGLRAATVKAQVEAHVMLRFSSGLQPRGSTVALVPERGEPRALGLEFGPAPGDVAATVPPLAPGRYTLRYHVIAADGHPTDGEEPIRVVAPD